MSRDPESGDPSDPPSLHKYLYARHDPVNWSDPTGRQAELETALVYRDISESPQAQAGVTALAAAIVCEYTFDASWIYQVLAYAHGPNFTIQRVKVCWAKVTGDIPIPRRGPLDAPFDPEEEITDPSKSWKWTGDDDYEGTCPAGAPRKYQRLHRDEGLGGKGPHWDYTDCDGKTFYIWPDGTMSPAI